MSILKSTILKRKTPLTSLILQLPLIIENSSKRSNNSNTLKENDIKNNLEQQKKNTKNTENTEKELVLKRNCIVGRWHLRMRHHIVWSRRFTNSSPTKFC